MIEIIKNYKIWYSLSALFIVAGIVIFAIFQFNFGIDFTGGTMLQIDLHQNIGRDQVIKDVESFNLSPQVVHAGKLKNEVVIKTKEKLDSQKRLEVFGVFKEKYNLESKDLISSEQFSANVSSENQLNAVLSVLLASVLMLIYITIRFEAVFGIGAIISLVHDVLFLLAFYAIFRLPVNSNFIAAVLTVVGYSINDTIVVYDRIREDSRRVRVKNHMEIAANSVNKTLKRTMNTSITTLSVIACLYIFGVSTIKEFALPLFVGVAVGTYSSIFIASASWALIRDKLSNKDKYSAKKA